MTSPPGSAPAPPGVLVQPMLSGGVEVIAGVVQEPVFGPLVVFGLGDGHECWAIKRRG